MTSVENILKCPICDSDNIEDLIFIEEFPYFNAPIKKSEKLNLLNVIKDKNLNAPLDIRSCNNCIHCFLGTLPDQEVIDTLYKNYYSYPSPLNGKFTPKRDDRFIEIFNEKIKSICDNKQLNTILEIGCYDGYILYHLKRLGFDVTGCDPSDGADIGKEFGIEIFRSFFNPSDFNKYDIVISRHYIEHVVNPVEWIGSMSKVLNDGGILIIETPNIRFYLEKGLIEVFSHQHLHGFSINSLSYALALNGMRVLSMEETPENLIIIVEKGIKPNLKTEIISNEVFRDYAIIFNENKEKIKGILEGFIINKERNIGMWGAGGFGLAALTLYGISDKYISFIIDSDPLKWEMEYLSNSIPIISPIEAIKKYSPSLIIVTSMYSDNIIEQIRKMNIKCKILTIFPKVSLI